MKDVTASGLHRVAQCDGPRVLPASATSSSDSDVGTWKHRYCETRDAASIPEEYREECERIDLDALPVGSSEITVGWHPGTGKGFWLGRLGIARAYPPDPGVIWGTADILQTHSRHVEVSDLKFGHGYVPHARENLQLGFLALAACEFLGMSTARVRVVRGREDGSIFTESEAELGVYELADVRRIVRDIAERKPRASNLHEGWWCKYCECFASCPAKQRTVALALGEAETTELSAETAPLFLERLETLKAVVKKAEGVAKGYVETFGPVQVGERTYGPVPRRSVNSGVALRVLGSELGLDAVRDAQKTSTSQAEIERVAKARGLEPAARRALFEKIRVAGGFDTREEIRWH